MTKETDKKTVSDAMTILAKKRHAKKTPDERSAHAKMMVDAREEKKAKNKDISLSTDSEE